MRLQYIRKISAMVSGHSYGCLIKLPVMIATGRVEAERRSELLGIKENECLCGGVTYRRLCLSGVPNFIPVVIQNVGHEHS